jgi:hypothetical protein
MPHFIVIGVAAAAAYAGWKFLKREMNRVDARLAEVREAGTPQPSRVERGQRLERDPSTGVYRPSEDVRG